ncbi:MAG: malto-oligosyltrehalose trehalohydrolase [Proteobacteria bacterium]|nr:malto-oligosyltrehalose trehalohydrolase [Pseudomonadota bacterium]MBU1986433.1 malto-oligosyltrehalose trehalohydrolase [Pseudomonadota bacterium]
MKQVCHSASLVLGPTLLQDGVFFRVWAPRTATVAVRQISDKGSNQDGTIELMPEEKGYFSGFVPCMEAGTLYTFLLDNRLERPDPASRCQPQGVHGPSQVLDPSSHGWMDSDWHGRDLADFIIYEIHVGTFTADGTFAGVEHKLDYLCELGITAVELMPVAQFPGGRNWGYDGVYLYAVQTSYGGADGLKSLVDACHRQGIAVILDVVYNHLGPEGNYLHAFGPYFTDRYRTPWGDAVNFDGPGSDGVREYIVGNALFWIEEYHIDALRLDAVHGIFDFSARHILDELGEAVHQLGATLGRKTYVIAESDLNDSRLIRPRREGGYGLDAQWNDDFHHALHTLLTEEEQGYYQDFGEFEQLCTAFREGFVYTGQFSSYRQRRHGNDASDISPSRFVVCSQNHDQVGNRKDGDRLAEYLDLERLKLAAGTVLFSPFLPLLFMGEEYGETAPFHYFVSHSDTALIQAVRCGRKEEFAAFNWEGEVVDPQKEATFQGSRINTGLRLHGRHGLLYGFHRRLIALRQKHRSLGVVSRQDCSVTRTKEWPLLLLTREVGPCRSLCILNFGTVPLAVDLPWPGGWDLLLDSSGSEWGGPGTLLPGRTRQEEGALCTSNPLSVVVFLAADKKWLQANQTELR